jgi:tetratricopeptide (TPR) repeat protein
MSTEQKPASTDQNALASGLTSAWTRFKQGKLLSYPMMALILLVVTGIGFGWWLISEGSKEKSAKWTEWDKEVGQSGSIASIKEYAEKNPGTTQGKLANLEIARLQLDREGIQQLNNPFNPVARAAGFDSIEKAREGFEKSADDFKDDKVLYPECLYGRAVAEAVLIGELKPGQLEKFRGDPDKAIELLDKVVAFDPDNEWGKNAKKLADLLRTNRADVFELQKTVYQTLTFPKLPPPDSPFEP